jgi:hypothetical protein
MHDPNPSGQSDVSEVSRHERPTKDSCGSGLLERPASESGWYVKLHPTRRRRPGLSGPAPAMPDTLCVGYAPSSRSRWRTFRVSSSPRSSSSTAGAREPRRNYLAIPRPSFSFSWRSPATKGCSPHRRGRQCYGCRGTGRRPRRRWPSPCGAAATCPRSAPMTRGPQPSVTSPQMDHSKKTQTPEYMSSTGSSW